MTVTIKKRRWEGSGGTSTNGGPSLNPTTDLPSSTNTTTGNNVHGIVNSQSEGGNTAIVGGVGKNMGHLTTWTHLPLDA